jgi:hypothetical protein
MCGAAHATPPSRSASPSTPAGSARTPPLTSPSAHRAVPGSSPKSRRSPSAARATGRARSWPGRGGVTAANAHAAAWPSPAAPSTAAPGPAGMTAAGTSPTSTAGSAGCSADANTDASGSMRTAQTSKILYMSDRGHAVSRPFVGHISAISPLVGDAIDGTPQSKPKLFPRKERREPLDRSLTFFCSNPQCDHKTWAPQEQARHMAREFWEVAQALVRLAPDSPEALKLTGDVILSKLTDDECRDGASAYSRFAAAGALDEMPLVTRLIKREYERRATAGELTPYEGRTMCLKGLHALTEDNLIYNSAGWRQCRACYRETSQKRRARKRELHASGDHSRCSPSACAAALAALGPEERAAAMARTEARKQRKRQTASSPESRERAAARQREPNRERRKLIRELHAAGDHSICYPSSCEGRRVLDGNRMSA